MKKLPKDAIKYFGPDSDREFKKKHPIGYKFLVVFLLTALLLPMAALVILEILFPIHNGGFKLPACLGALLIGTGLSNLVAKIIDQYLGDWLTLGCFGLGGLIMGTSCWFLFVTDLRLNEKLLDVYFFTPLLLMVPLIVYTLIRSRMDDLLKSRGLRERDIDRRKKGKRNFWWYEDLREELGGLYGFNRFVTVFWPALMAAALLLGWIPVIALLVAAGHGILSLCMAGMLLYCGRSVKKAFEDLYWPAFSLLFVWIHIHGALELMGWIG